MAVPGSVASTVSTATHNGLGTSHLVEQVDRYRRARRINFYADHTPSPGSNLRIDGDRWLWDGTGFPPIVREASLANTLVIDADPADQAVVRGLPAFLCKASCASQIYSPDAVIAGPLSTRAARRYRLGAGC